METRQQLTPESLRTLFYEAANIVNGRPLAVENLDDPFSPSPITPNHLLTMKTKVLQPPPGEFGSPDQYSRKRWRQVQYLTEQFWVRWRREYLSTLQIRPKWHRPQEFKGGSVVLVADSNPVRNEWHLGVIEDVITSKDGHVRTVNVRVKGKTLTRPINRIKMLIKSE
jgi:hypothetical protein